MPNPTDALTALERHESEVRRVLAAHCNPDNPQGWPTPDERQEILISFAKRRLGNATYLELVPFFGKQGSQARLGSIGQALEDMLDNFIVPHGAESKDESLEALIANEPDIVSKRRKLAADSTLDNYFADISRDLKKHRRKAKSKPRMAAVRGKPGRPRETKADKLGQVAKSIIDNGDLEQYGREWKSLITRYGSKLPKGTTPDQLRKRVERIEKRAVDEK